MILFTERMGSERGMWGMTMKTEKEAKRNKFGCKILTVVEAGCPLPCLSCLVYYLK